LQVSFSRGFNRTISIKGVKDVMLMDVGGNRAADGRWPLVIDPSGRASTFVTYSGAAVFHMADMRTMDLVRLKKALLKAMMHGSPLIIDLESFDFETDVVEEPFNKIEPQLFKKLVDRSVLYSYLLPRRFGSWITPDIQQEFGLGAFLDENLQRFVLGFVTRVRTPDFDFAKQFYTISIKSDEEEA